MSHPQTTNRELDPHTLEFAASVRRGLSEHPQKTLDSRYLYDAVGSALFEAITQLPEYGVTRADERLIEQHSAELASRMSANAVVTELGSGFGTKTRRILTALSRKAPVAYRPIDVSASALDRCLNDLGQIDGVTVEPFQFSYIEGLKKAMEDTTAEQQVLLLFLGGTIGNFDRDAILPFLRRLRSILREGDAFLLGTDLEKPIRQLITAYDDPIGVTAAFNLNLLARINRELGGNMDLDQFEHVARYDEDERRIEMHLRSLSDQEAHIPLADLDVNFRQGETIWTESSHKFDIAEIPEIGKVGGFFCAAQWMDKEWAFAETLLVAE